MANPAQAHKSGPPLGLTVLIGAAIAVAGFFFSKNVKVPALEDLAARGLPIDPGKSIATIGVFIMLFPVIRMFFVDPLAKAIHERTRNLERAFGEAENLRSEMAQMKKDYETRLTSAEQAAREQIQAQIREAQELRHQLMAEASAKADQMVARAQDEIASERERVLTELRAHVVDLTLSATEKLLGESVDDAKNRKLVAEFIEKVEAPV